MSKNSRPIYRYRTKWSLIIWEFQFIKLLEWQKKLIIVLAKVPPKLLKSKVESLEENVRWEKVDAWQLGWLVGKVANNTSCNATLLT